MELYPVRSRCPMIAWLLAVSLLMVGWPVGSFADDRAYPARHNNFQEGRSYFNDGVDPAELLAGVHSGQYPVVGTGSRGYPIVDFGRPIGVDGRTGQTVTRGQIHYGNNGAHIVPDARN